MKKKGLAMPRFVAHYQAVNAQIDHSLTSDYAKTSSFPTQPGSMRSSSAVTTSHTFFWANCPSSLVTHSGTSALD